MEMQDKEFDGLFRSKLDDFEAEPSKAVWQNIAGELGEGKTKKRALWPFLSIAASIVILISAGILFITQRNGVSNHHPVKNQTANINKPLTIKPAAIAVIKLQPPTNTKTMVAALSGINHRYHTKKANVIIPALNQANITKQDVPVKTDAQQVLAAVPQNKIIIQQPEKIDSATVLAVTPPQNQTVKPVVIAAALPAADNPAVAVPAKKRRIRSLGDMLNVVIAAVDKRPDKIVQFSDTDDDESSITGVNIGIIKIKKEN